MRLLLVALLLWEEHYMPDKITTLIGERRRCYYLTLTLVDELAASDAALVDRMLQDTVNLLREFKKECLRCCE
jgi:hypothetical protein